MNRGELKRCYRCGEWKQPTAYYNNKRHYDGLDSACRKCSNAANAARRRAKRNAPDPRKGWCPNCRAGRHGRSCTAAFFGPDCACRCGVLGYRGPFPFADPTAPGPMDREIA